MSKIISVVSPKGGEGASFIASQLAYYAAYQLGFKTALVDLSCSSTVTDLLTDIDLAEKACLNSDELFSKEQVTPLELNDKLKLSFFPSDGQKLIELIEKPEEELKVYYSRFAKNLAQLDAYFDLIILDVPSTPDLRNLASLSLSSKILVTVQPLHESLLALSIFHEHSKEVKDKILGILPNRIKRDEQSLQNVLSLKDEDLLKAYTLKVTKSDTDYVVNIDTYFAGIKEHPAYAMAQALHVPIWIAKNILDSEEDRDSYQGAWDEINHVFFAILEMLDLSHRQTSSEPFNPEPLELLKKHKEWPFLLKYLWLNREKSCFSEFDEQTIEQLLALKKSYTIKELMSLS